MFDVIPARNSMSHTNLMEEMILIMRWQHYFKVGQLRIRLIIIVSMNLQTVVDKKRKMRAALLARLGNMKKVQN